MTADPTALRALADEVERLTERGNYHVECRIENALGPAVALRALAAIAEGDGNER